MKHQLQRQLQLFQPMSRHYHNEDLKPNLVEDEPVHEFYANLIGHKPKSYQQPQPAARPRPRPRPRPDATAARVPPVQAPTNTSSTVIPADTHLSIPIPAPIKSIYRKALDQPTQELSKISIDKTNKGFRMLTRMGWKESEGGLGRSRQGTLSPVKTRFKKDTRGIGSGKAKMARVTHRHSMIHSDADARDMKKNNGTQETKAERRRRIKLEAQKEELRNKRARLLITSDLPEAYHAYL